MFQHRNSRDLTLNASPDTDTLEALRARYGDRHKWLVLATVMIGTIASVMSSTIVNVAVPDMSRAFELGQERAQWVSAGFMAAMTMSMLLTPWLLARFGYRRTYTGAVALLLAGGLFGGLANHYPLVIAMRIVEGLAAGILQPIPGIIILRAFEPKEQGRASGIFGFGVVLAPAVGPTIGGVLVEHYGWRSIFFVVIPFCLIAMAMARRYLPRASTSANPARKLDVAGLLLGSLAIVCLMNGLVGLHDSNSSGALLLIALAPLLLAAFVVHCKDLKDPLLDLRVFAWRPFAMGSVVSFIYGVALFGSTYLVPVYMQLGLGFAPRDAGAALLPAGIALALSIPLAGRLADKRPPRHLVVFGLVLLALSFALTPLVTAVPMSVGFWLLVGFAVIGRIGLGFVLPSLNIGAMRGIDRSLIPEASSTISLLRQLGGALGVSLVGILLEWRLAWYGASLRGTSEATGDRLAAFSEMFVVLAVICALAMFGALRMRAPKT